MTRTYLTTQRDAAVHPRPVRRALAVPNLGKSRFRRGAPLVCGVLLLAGCDPKEPEPRGNVQELAPESRAPHSEAPLAGAEVVPNPHAAQKPDTPVPPSTANPHRAQLPPGSKDPHAASGGPAAAAGQPEVQVTWDVPGDWKKMPARMMRQATYEAAGPAGPAEIAVYYFGPGQGGDVEANITRWVGQFQNLPKDAAQRSKSVINGMDHFRVRVVKGTYAASMMRNPSPPKKDWGLSGAIVSTPSGNYFFKMTGPAATVTAQLAQFDRLLQSVRSKS